MATVSLDEDKLVDLARVLAGMVLAELRPEPSGIPVSRYQLGEIVRQAWNAWKITQGPESVFDGNHPAYQHIGAYVAFALQPHVFKLTKENERLKARIKELEESQCEMEQQAKPGT